MHRELQIFLGTQPAAEQKEQVFESLKRRIVQTSMVLTTLSNKLTFEETG